MAKQSQITKIKAAISRLKDPEVLKAIGNHTDDVYCKRVSECNETRNAKMFKRLAASPASADFHCCRKDARYKQPSR